MDIRTVHYAMSNGKEQVNVMVDSELKKEWKEAAEDDEYGSLSQLIRRSVGRELAGEYEVARRQEGDSTESTASSEVEDTLNRIETTLGSMDSRLSAVERETSGSATKDIQNVVFESLPIVDDEHVRAKDAPSYGISTEALAQKVGEDEDDVISTLSNLQDMTKKVKEVSGEDNQYWWRRD